jgi:Ni/Co efflux regulator RcnB
MEAQLQAQARPDRADRRADRREERQEARQEERDAFRERIRSSREASRRGMEGISDPRFLRRAEQNQRRYEEQLRERRAERLEDRRDYRQDRREYRQERRAWNRGWRYDRRYDWQRYRYANRSIFSPGYYYAPYRGHRYSRFSIGLYLDSGFFSNRYWISDPWRYRLPPAYHGTRWVRYYDDVLLVDLYTGEVLDVIYDFFW